MDVMVRCADWLQWMLKSELPEEAKEYPAEGNGLPVLSFSRNWNNKLDCQYFSTIRRDGGTGWYQLGKQFAVELKLSSYAPARTMGVARVTKLVSITAEQINDSIAFLDAGMPADQLRGMLGSMYQKYGPLHEQRFLYLVCRYVAAKGGSDHTFYQR